MTWDGMLARHGRALSAAGNGGELVTWTPAAAGVDPRTFRAQVIRTGDQVITSQSHDRVQRAIVELPVGGATQGIDLAVFDAARDRVDVALVRGRPAVPCYVVQVLQSDAGSVKVEVEATGAAAP